jgi:hypothetical protein
LAHLQALTCLTAACCRPNSSTSATRTCEDMNTVRPSATISWGDPPRSGQPGFRVNRGAAYTRTHHFDCAIADLDQAVRLNPNNAVTFLDRGVAYAKRA